MHSHDYSVTSNLYFLIFSPILPTLLPSGNCQNILRIYESVSITLVRLFSFLDPALALMPDNSVYPHMSLILFKLLPQCWSSEAVSPAGPRTSPLEECLRLQNLCLVQPQSSLMFTEAVGTSLPGAGTLGWGAWWEVGSLALEGAFPQPSYPSQILPAILECGISWFCISAPPSRGAPFL